MSNPNDRLNPTNGANDATPRPTYHATGNSYFQRQRELGHRLPFEPGYQCNFYFEPINADERGYVVDIQAESVLVTLGIERDARTWLVPLSEVVPAFPSGFRDQMPDAMRAALVARGMMAPATMPAVEVSR